MANEMGLRIRKIRKENKDTLAALAKKIDYDYSNLSKIERGKYKPPLDVLERISNAYDIDISYFFGEKQEVPEELEGKVDWIAFGEEMEERDLTPDEIRTIVNIIQKNKLNE